MKQVIAIIRINMVNRTKQALVDAGFAAFTVRKVLGRGKGQVDFRVLHGAEIGHSEAIAHLKDDGPMLIPKRMMSIVVAGEAVPQVVETIIKTNQTGKPGDGKIFILPVSEAIRIRTGEAGAKALAE
jgi:nitrogen regulatory protein PII 2